MLETILNKALVLLFMLAMLNAIRHGYYFIQAAVSSNDEIPTKYVITNKQLLLLGLSLAYLLSVIFTGITI